MCQLGWSAVLHMKGNWTVLWVGGGSTSAADTGRLQRKSRTMFCLCIQHKEKWVEGGWVNIATQRATFLFCGLYLSLCQNISILGSKLLTGTRGEGGFIG